MAVTVLGMMSGTSLDGVDAAVLRTDGERILGFGATGYRAYTPDERACLRAALQRWPGEPGVSEAARVVTAAHAELASRFGPVNLVGMHGQTLAHEPGGRGTHQVGDAEELAKIIGAPVAWDFRTADVAAGGEGAPLAPFFHFAAARWAGLSGEVAVLNLGGVGNLTLLDADATEPEAAGALVAFDSGPANAPIDDLVSRRTGASWDSDGRLGAAGRPDPAVIRRFLAEPYLQQPPPKSLDRNAFEWLAEAVDALGTSDAAATLVAVAAAGVAQGLQSSGAHPARILATGGGRHNPALLSAVAEAARCEVVPIECVGLDGDMLEAQAFAYLAVRVLRGLPLTAPGTTGVPAPQPGGRIAGERPEL